MRSRYFKAQSGPLYDALVLCVNEKREALIKARDLCREIGAESGFYAESGLVGFVWDDETPPKHVKASKGRHTHDEKCRQIMVPDLRFKAGKELRCQMKAIAFPDAQKAGAEAIQCQSQWIPANDARSPSGMSIFSYTFGFKDGTALAQVPIAEPGDDASDNDAYSWNPPDISGLVEITHGELVDLSESNR